MINVKNHINQHNRNVLTNVIGNSTNDSKKLHWNETITLFKYLTSSAFDTIDRQTVLNIADRIIDEDESRILRALLCGTTLEIKVKDATSTPFISNIGSPQGDSITGPMFTCVLNEAIKEILEEV